MRKLLIIGIGAGDPDQITVQAIKAIKAADVFFVMDKGTAKQDLTRLREEICERYAEPGRYKIVQAPDPQRDRTAADYRSAVEHWRGQRAQIYAALIEQELRDGQCGAFLVWGDPAIYDSTLAIVEQIAAQGTMEFEYQVIPGISSVQALAARHRVSLTQVGKPLHITTGRRLADSAMPAGSDDVVVMLDAGCSFSAVTDQAVEIYWGAYLGTADEIVVSGKLGDVAERIRSAREEARERKGWIMDTYLLRRRGEP
jgi:precorrin-6A synthase